MNASRRPVLPGGEPGFAEAACDARALERVATRMLELGGRALLLGAPGTGKSTLSRCLAASLASRGAPPRCVSADPGSPGFGVPGAVCLGAWDDGGWKLEALEALCSLDAGRFRLPLTQCVRRLVPPGRSAPLIVDGPGVVRGVAGAELLAGLVEAAGIDLVLSFERGQRQPLMEGTLAALGVEVLAVRPAEAARRPGKAARGRHRTALWDAHLADAALHVLDIDSSPVLGTPPPLEAPGQWQGRQAALIGADGRTAALGEIVELRDGQLRLRCDRPPQPGHALLVRDARRETGGLLGSAGADAADAVRYAPPADVLPGYLSPGGPRPVVRAGPLTAALVNGVTGDPLLHVRLQHRRRSLLFDLGEAGRLPARIAHQVSDVFLSHAHIDHVAGFLWLIRSRIGELPAVRVFGPPGIAGNVRGMLAGIHWDRVGSRGPRFEVCEFDGERQTRMRIQAGGGEEDLGPSPAPGGLLLAEPELQVRCCMLDHGTPVLAYALETGQTLKVRKERLLASGLRPGPWLTQLKRLAGQGDRASRVSLPDGRVLAGGELMDDLLLAAAGVKLAYATDLADTEANRARLAALAAGAHTLFCEASFRLADTIQARRTGHLTTRACGEIAARAAVERLVPFHFSRRYEDDLAAVYDEVRAAFSRTITPTLRERAE